MIKRKIVFFSLLFFICYFLFVFPLSAQHNEASGLNFFPAAALWPYIANSPEIVSRAAVLVDAETGTVLYAKNPNMEIPPASLTKLMTMHLVMREIDAGHASYDEIVPIGIESWAQSQPPRSSLMFLEPGQTVTLREILLGLAVSSGNDAAVAAALHVAPSVQEFAGMMTREARRLGLTRTIFVEPSGISENNITTAAEFSTFCLEYLRLYPQSLVDFHSVREFAYPTAAHVTQANRNRPNTIVQASNNTLLWTFPGVDGLKTGYIVAAGHNIALTAHRNNTRFVAVILGAPSNPGGARIREQDGEQLLSWAFENFKTVRPQIGPLEPVRLWKSRTRLAELHPEESLSFTAPHNRASWIYYTIEIDEPLVAPLPAYHPAGWLVITDREGELHRVRLFTNRSYQQGNFFRRIWDGIRLLFR